MPGPVITFPGGAAGQFGALTLCRDCKETYVQDKYPHECRRKKRRKTTRRL